MVADAYLSALAGSDDLILPQVDSRASHVWHLFVIRTKERDALKAYLAGKNIQTVINYPVALPFLDAYEHQSNRAEDFPAYQHQGQILSLPVFSRYDLEQVNYVTAICFAICIFWRGCVKK